MKKSADPKWIQAIDQGLGAFLYLYPSEFRKEYGPMIRQAMRDRCREVVKGQRSMFRVMALELIPDIVLGAAKEQMSSNFGQLSKRHYVALSLLVALSFVGQFREPLSTKVFDQASYADKKVDELKYRHRLKTQREEIEGFAQWLVEKDQSPKSKVLAAYLYQSWHFDGNDPWHSIDQSFEAREKQLARCEHEKKADELINEVLAERPDAMVLAIALRVCNSESGCDQEKILRRLADYDANNAYVWQVSLGRAINEKDAIGERYALKRIAASNKNINYEQKIRTELISYAHEYAPKDKFLSESLFYLGADDDYDTSYALAKGRCWNLHKESRDIELEQDCKSAAAVLSTSSAYSTTGRHANIILHRLSSNETERSAAYEKLRNISWWELENYRSSKEARIGIWMQRDDLVENIQTSLRDHGKPIVAPPDFDISEWEKQYYDLDIAEADKSLGMQGPS